MITNAVISAALLALSSTTSSMEAGLKALEKKDYAAAAAAFESAKKQAPANLYILPALSEILQSEAAIRQGGATAETGRAAIKKIFTANSHPALRQRALSVWTDGGGKAEALLPKISPVGRFDLMLKSAKEGKNAEAESALALPLLGSVRDINKLYAAVVEVEGNGPPLKHFLSEIAEEDFKASPIQVDAQTGTAEIWAGDARKKMRVHATCGPEGWQFNQVLEFVDSDKFGGQFPDEMSEKELPALPPPAILPPPASPEQAEQIKKWIATLGAASPAERATARTRLTQMGAVTLPFLNEATRSDDPEIAETARELVKKNQIVPVEDKAGAAVCLNNMRILESATEQFAVENGLKNKDVAPWSGLMSYVKNRNISCPAGGTYAAGIIGTEPRCSVHGTLSETAQHVRGQ